jgi:hypothetical protein
MTLFQALGTDFSFEELFLLKTEGRYDAPSLGRVGAAHAG